jgi:tetratricopeptide (TPR) repeat protein
MVKRIAVAVVLLASTAHADSEEAKQLFERGRTQKAAGDLEAACKLFDESYAIERAAGTALNLAECEERVGNWEFALELYDGAAKWFEQEGRADSATFARDRATMLRTAHTLKPRPLPPEPTRSKTPLVVAGVSFGVAALTMGYWAYQYSIIRDFETSENTSMVTPPKFPDGSGNISIGEDDCGDLRFADAGEQRRFERACRAYDRSKYAPAVVLATSLVGAGALIYYFVAKPKAHSAPMIAPTASGGVAATFEW